MMKSNPVALWERSELVVVRGYFLNPKLEYFINLYSLLLGPEMRQWMKPNNFQPLLLIYISYYITKKLRRNYKRLTCHYITKLDNTWRAEASLLS